MNFQWIDTWLAKHLRLKTPRQGDEVKNSADQRTVFASDGNEHKALFKQKLLTNCRQIDSEAAK